MKITQNGIKTIAKTMSTVPDPVSSSSPLEYKVIAKCSTTKARVGMMNLRHSDVDTPVFMPVGTQVTTLVI